MYVIGSLTTKVIMDVTRKCPKRPAPSVLQKWPPWLFHLFPYRQKLFETKKIGFVYLSLSTSFHRTGKKLFSILYMYCKLSIWPEKREKEKDTMENHGRQEFLTWQIEIKLSTQIVVGMSITNNLFCKWCIHNFMIYSIFGRVGRKNVAFAPKFLRLPSIPQNTSNLPRS